MRFWKKKKERKEERTDFSKYKIKINGKVMCAYEAITGRPFLKIKTFDDVVHLLYCSLVINNEEFETMEFDTFQYLLSDEEIVEWLSDEYSKIGKFMSQFRLDVCSEKTDDEEVKKASEKDFYMLDAVSCLIVKMGLDPDYVMYRMDEWEIAYYFNTMKDMDKTRLTENRLWTYLQILPHVGKKLSGPEKLLPFPWEKEDKRKQKELENNTKAAIAFLGGNRNGNKKPDNTTEQE